jgi:hypothetical protein
VRRIGRNWAGFDRKRGGVAYKCGGFTYKCEVFDRKVLFFLHIFTYKSEVFDRKRGGVHINVGVLIGKWGFYMGVRI